MNDSITIDVNPYALFRAIDALGQTAQDEVNDASGVTAQAIVQEARSRLQRQLGPHATGETVASIVARPARDGNGWIVIVDRPTNPDLPFWIEKGTKEGAPHSHTSAPRKFFYDAVFLEQAAALRRWEDALQRAIDAQGLGS